MRTVEVVALIVANAMRHVDICVPNHAAYRHRGHVCARNAVQGNCQGAHTQRLFELTAGTQLRGARARCTPRVRARGAPSSDR